MNKFISEIYGRLLGALHFVVIALLGLFTALDLLGLLGSSDLSYEGKAMRAAAVFAGYILFAGFASTVVRMNENLERIADTLAKTHSSTSSGSDSPGAKSVRPRSEPPLRASS